MIETLAMTKALSDENRLRVLMALGRGELCLCQIVGLLQLAPSTVSKHMAVLYQARLVESRKEGRWMYYRLPGRAAPKPVARIVRWVQDCLRDDPRIRRDEQRLRTLLLCNREELSHCYDRPVRHPKGS